MFCKSGFSGLSPRSALTVLAAALLAVAFTKVSSAGAETLASFCAKLSCTDGTSPSADLAMDTAGHVFGTTAGGGNHSSGSIFELALDAETGKWRRTMLHGFCAAGYPCADGSSPAGRLVVDVNGNVYGTATGGGAGQGGTVFRLSYDSSHGWWMLKVLYAFCSSANCADGKAPASGLTYQGQSAGAPYDGVSALYGTAQAGGAHGGGVAFAIVPQPATGKWSEKELYSFCARQHCSDGAQPWQSLWMDVHGALYGVTANSAQANAVAFRLKPGTKGAWTETVLHRFCIDGCSTGSSPNALIADASGKLFGSASGGGAHGSGVLFALMPDGESWHYRVLHHFCAQQNCLDGAMPLSVLALDGQGNLYGTTYYGGRNLVDRDEKGGGTIFRLSPAGQYRIVHHFCSLYACADGEYPKAGVLMDGSGGLFGTTQLGGRYTSYFQGGVAYRVSD